MPIVHVHSLAEFQTKIRENAMVVVDFYATWCGPCTAIAPHFESMSEKYKSVVFLKVNVDEVPDVASSSGISAMPTFHFFKSGKKVDELVGADIRVLEAKVKAVSGSN